MKKMLCLVPFVLNATTITTLLNDIKNTSDYKLDRIVVSEMKVNKENVINSLYPKLNVEGSIVHSNIPSSMRPLPPTEVATTKNLPFSQNIYRIGFNFSLPIFVKEIYDKKKQMESLLTSAKYKTQISLLQKQATLVTLVSQLNYLFSLKKALLGQKKSIQTTYKAMNVGVKVGRIPGFKKLRLKDSLNQIDIKLSNLTQNIIKIKNQIYKLTKVYVKNKIILNSSKIEKGEFISIKPLKNDLQASRYLLQSNKDKFLPKIEFKVEANRAFANAYNTGNGIALNYATGGIYIVWNLFDKERDSSIQKSKIVLNKTSLEIIKIKKDLGADIVEINNSLKELKKQIMLTKKSINLKQELLKGAKVAFEMDRMDVDTYLGYEDNLAKEKANLANLIAVKNSLIAKKALIYGKNLTKVFK